MTPRERALELLAETPPLTDEQVEQAARLIVTFQSDEVAA